MINPPDMMRDAACIQGGSRIDYPIAAHIPDARHHPNLEDGAVLPADQLSHARKTRSAAGSIIKRCLRVGYDGAIDAILK